MKKSTAPSLSQIIEAIESRIPPACAESWDNVGLLCGDSKQTLRSILIGVDLTTELLQQAIKRKANFIIIHHPPLFPNGAGIKKLILKKENDLNTLLLQAFQKNICIYVAHTNFDRCALDGMIDLAQALGAEPHARVWEDGKKPVLKKLVTFIPEKKFEKVRDALYAAGCGHIGNYDSCGFAMPGVGNFRGLEGANPAIGKVGELESVQEIRFETIFPVGIESIVVETLKHVHPYEEVAYDIYSVEQKPAQKGMVWGLGYGFVADFKKPITLDALIRKIKTVFQVDAFLTNRVAPKKIKRIAFSPGKGSSFISSALSQGVDVYLTGEVGYHGSLDATREDLCVMELGHRESEIYFLKTFSAWFQEWRLPHQVLDERPQHVV